MTESDQLTVLPRPARQVANTVLLLFLGQSDGMIALLQEQGVRGCIIIIEGGVFVLSEVTLKIDLLMFK